MTRVCAVVFLCLIAFPAQASMPCSVIRSAVAKYGLEASKAWARSKGFSEKYIEELERKCLAK